MTTRRISFLSCLLAASIAVSFAAVGCSSNSTSTGSTTGTSSATACGDYAQARCTKFAACETTGVQSRYGDQATCLSRETTSCTNGLAAPGTGNTPDAVEACVAAFASYACADFLNGNPPTACQSKQGTNAKGQPCAFNAQCQTAFCTVPKGSDCGMCADPPKAGDDCSIVTNCGYNLVCSKLTQTCTAWGTVGIACTKGDNTCGFGFGCAGATDTTPGTCQPVATLGQPCGNKAAPPYVCDSTAGLFCGKGGTCETASLPTTGGACGRIDADGGVDAGTYGWGFCVGASSCSAPDAGQGYCQGPATEGASCDTTSHLGCMAPARCVGTATEAGVTGTCQIKTGTDCH